MFVFFCCQLTNNRGPGAQGPPIRRVSRTPRTNVGAGAPTPLRVETGLRRRRCRATGPLASRSSQSLGPLARLAMGSRASRHGVQVQGQFVVFFVFFVFFCFSVLFFLFFLLLCFLFFCCFLFLCLFLFFLFFVFLCVFFLEWFGFDPHLRGGRDTRLIGAPWGQGPWPTGHGPELSGSDLGPWAPWALGPRARTWAPGQALFPEGPQGQDLGRRPTT